MNNQHHPEVEISTPHIDKRAKRAVAKARYMRRFYRGKVRARKCPGCGRPAQADHVKCRRCGARDNARAKARYALMSAALAFVQADREQFYERVVGACPHHD